MFPTLRDLSFSINCGIYCIEILERHFLSLYSLNLDQNLTYSCLKDFRLALKKYLNVSLADMVESARVIWICMKKEFDVSGDGIKSNI